MSLVHPVEEEVVFKVLYAGPHRAGKTTNLQVLHQQTEGSLRPLVLECEPTLYFDFLPLALKRPQGLDVRLHLVSFPGLGLLPELASSLLKGVDAVVFVADATPHHMARNIESMTYLMETLEKLSIDPLQIPFCVQANKRELSDAASLADMQATLTLPHASFIPATAVEGVGSLETLRSIASKLI